MVNKLLSITVKGKTETWTFDFYGDPKYLDEWRKDGLEIDEIRNQGPQWVADIGLFKVWCFFQDIWNFNNPFTNPIYKDDIDEN